MGFVPAKLGHMYIMNDQSNDKSSHSESDILCFQML